MATNNKRHAEEPDPLTSKRKRILRPTYFRTPLEIVNKFRTLNYVHEQIGFGPTPKFRTTVTCDGKVFTGDAVSKKKSKLQCADSVYLAMKDVFDKELKEMKQQRADNEIRKKNDLKLWAAEILKIQKEKNVEGIEISKESYMFKDTSLAKAHADIKNHPLQALNELRPQEGGYYFKQISKRGDRQTKMVTFVVDVDGKKYTNSALNKKLAKNNIAKLILKDIFDLDFGELHDSNGVGLNSRGNPCRQSLWEDIRKNFLGITDNTLKACTYLNFFYPTMEYKIGTIDDLTMFSAKITTDTGREFTSMGRSKKLAKSNVASVAIKALTSDGTLDSIKKAREKTNQGSKKSNVIPSWAGMTDGVERGIIAKTKTNLDGYDTGQRAPRDSKKPPRGIGKRLRSYMRKPPSPDSKVDAGGGRAAMRPRLRSSISQDVELIKSLLDFRPSESISASQQDTYIDNASQSYPNFADDNYHGYGADFDTTTGATFGAPEESNVEKGNLSRNRMDVPGFQRKTYYKDNYLQRSEYQRGFHEGGVSIDGMLFRGPDPRSKNTIGPGRRKVSFKPHYDYSSIAGQSTSSSDYFSGYNFNYDDHFSHQYDCSSFSHVYSKKDYSDVDYRFNNQQFNSTTDSYFDNPNNMRPNFRGPIPHQGNFTKPFLPDDKSYFSPQPENAYNSFTDYPHQQQSQDINDGANYQTQNFVYYQMK